MWSTFSESKNNDLFRQNLCGNGTGTDSMPKYRYRSQSHISCSVKVQHNIQWLILSRSRLSSVWRDHKLSWFQFDTSATTVIMTRTATKVYFHLLWFETWNEFLYITDSFIMLPLDYITRKSMMIYCMEINWWKAGINSFFDNLMFISWNVFFLYYLGYNWWWSIHLMRAQPMYSQNGHVVLHSWTSEILQF